MGILQDLNVRTSGEGPETVVLVHGFGTDQTVWRHVLSELPTGRRAIRFDLPCAGSVRPEVFNLKRHGSLDGYVDDLLLVLSESRVRRCTFVGHSVGSMIGLIAALRAPELFERLIMIAASPRYIDDGNYRGGFEPRAIAEIYDAILANYQEWAKTFAPLAVQRDANHPAAQEFATGLLAMRPDIAINTAIMIFQSDLRDRVKGFPLPVVIVQAENDPAVPMAVAEWLRDNIPGSILEPIRATGHLPHMTSPAEVARVLRKHL